METENHCFKSYFLSFHSLSSQVTFISQWQIFHTVEFPQYEIFAILKQLEKTMMYEILSFYTSRQRVIKIFFPTQLGPVLKYQSLDKKQTEEAREAFNQPNKHVAMIEPLTLVIRAGIFNKLDSMIVLGTKSLSQKINLIEISK